MANSTVTVINARNPGFLKSVINDMHKTGCCAAKVIKLVLSFTLELQATHKESRDVKGSQLNTNCVGSKFAFLGGCYGKIYSEENQCPHIQAYGLQRHAAICCGNNQWPFLPCTLIWGMSQCNICPNAMSPKVQQSSAQWQRLYWARASKLSFKASTSRCLS